MFHVLSLVPAQVEHTWVVDLNRDPTVLYCPNDTLITTLNVSVKNEEYCESQPCFIDDRDQEAVRRLCDNTDFCLIYGSNFSSACLQERQRFNMSYMCEAPASLDCNFEDGLHVLCSWEQGIDDEFDWTRNCGWTITGSTGPSNDHTTRSGFYMYIQSSGKDRNDTAQLISKTIVRETEQCLTFWYHMRGSDIGSLKVYQKQNMSIKCIWRKVGPQKSQWIRADVNLAKYDYYQIVFEGVIKDANARSKGDIAIDDVYVSDGKCNGSVEQPSRCSLSNDACREDDILDRKCLSIDQEYTIEECATFYLQIDSLDERFYPISNNGKECISTENERVMKLENFCMENYLYSHCVFNMSRIFGDDNECNTFKKKILITYLCSDMRTNTVSSDSVSGDSSGDSSSEVETTKLSPFTTSGGDPSTVSDKSVTPSKEIKHSSNSTTGLVVGLVIGCLLLACAVILIIVVFRRHTLKSRTREKLSNNHGGNDYIGSQDIVLPQTIAHSSHMQNDGMHGNLERRNTSLSVHGYESTLMNTVQHNYVSVGATNQNETTLNETIENMTGTADSYMVLDPIETGFNRQIFSNNSTDYELAHAVQDSENKLGEDDQYAISQEGVYDHSGSNRHKELENNIYNHAVDTIYDSGSHKRNDELEEDSYDHFFGQKTEDEYDVSTTT